MRVCEIGVFHHNCWFNKTINDFPEVDMKEISSRVSEYENKKKVNHGVFRVIASGEEEIKKIIESIKYNPEVLEVTSISIDKGIGIIGVSWHAQKTSYDSIIQSGCAYTSATYSKQGYETYSLFSNKPKEIEKLLEEFDQIGETKIFKIKQEEELVRDFDLTSKQMKAILTAIKKGYYEWPKKASLEELAESQGQKRRAFQENLRKAESKIFKRILDQLLQ